MLLLVNNADVTGFVIENSIEIHYYGAFRCNFSFSMEVSQDALPELCAGMEVRIYEAGVPICGGIMESCLYIHRSLSSTGINCVCKGYEQVLSRRVAFPVSETSESAAAIAKTLFDRYLAAEGFKKLDANFEDFLINGYTTVKPMRLSKVFDGLASISDYCWWIDCNKYFYFKRKTAVTNRGYRIDLDSREAGGSVLGLSFLKKIGDYRNSQTVTGHENVYFTVVNNAEIQRMAPYFGSGRYENLVENSRLMSSWATETAATELLGANDSELFYVSFTTTEGTVRQFDKIAVKGSRYGLSDFTFFIVTDVTVRRTKNKFLYEITAKRSDSSSVRPEAAWTDILGKVL